MIRSLQEYMRQTYRAQAFLSSKFLCNKQQPQKDRNQNRNKDNTISNKKRKESEPEVTYKKLYKVSCLGSNSNRNSRSKIFPYCYSGVFSKYYHSYVIDSTHKKKKKERWSIKNFTFFSFSLCSFVTKVAQLLLPGFKKLDGT